MHWTRWRCVCVYLATFWYNKSSKGTYVPQRHHFISTILQHTQGQRFICLFSIIKYQSSHECSDEERGRKGDKIIIDTWRLGFKQKIVIWMSMRTNKKLSLLVFFITFCIHANNDDLASNYCMYIHRDKELHAEMQSSQVWCTQINFFLSKTNRMWAGLPSDLICLRGRHCYFLGQCHLHPRTSRHRPIRPLPSHRIPCPRRRQDDGWKLMWSDFACCCWKAWLTSPRWRRDNSPAKTNLNFYVNF